jgi:hypothetical protein
MNALLLASGFFTLYGLGYLLVRLVPEKQIHRPSRFEKIPWPDPYLERIAPFMLTFGLIGLAVFIGISVIAN